LRAGSVIEEGLSCGWVDLEIGRIDEAVASLSLIKVASKGTGSTATFGDGGTGLTHSAQKFSIAALVDGGVVAGISSTEGGSTGWAEGTIGDADILRLDIASLAAIVVRLSIAAGGADRAEQTQNQEDLDDFHP